MVLVRTTDAIRLCHEDDRELLPLCRAVAWVGRLGRREMAAVRDFVARARLSACSLRSDGATTFILTVPAADNVPLTGIATAALAAPSWMTFCAIETSLTSYLGV
jgi:hypothetical protein